MYLLPLTICIYVILELSWASILLDSVEKEDLHFVWYINNIVHRHTAQGSSIVTSRPNTNRHSELNNLLHILLQRLHESSHWSLNLSQPDDEYEEEQIGTHKPQCYIILTWASMDVSEIVTTISEQISELKESASWNSNANFIIAVIGQVSEASGNLQLEILKEVKKVYKVLNVLVLLERTLEDKILVYSWIPYREKSRCGDIDKSKIFEEHAVESSGTFSNKNLFPYKIPNNMKGCSINISVLYMSPYAEVVSTYTNKDNKTVYNVGGIDISILSVILHAINITGTFYPPDINVMALTMHEKASHLILQLLTETEIGAGTLPPHIAALQYADITYHFLESPFKWYVPCPEPIPRLERLSKIFSPSAWITTLGIFLFGSIFLQTLAEKCEVLKLREYNTYKNIYDCATSLWAVTVGVAVKQLPYSIILRVFFLAWIWYSFAFCIVFQTFFTTFLVNPGFYKAITTMDELRESSLVYGYDEIFDYYVTVPVDSSQKRIKCTDNDCFLRYLQGDFATPSTIIHSKYLLKLYGINKPVCFLNEDIVSKKSTFYLRKGSPLLEKFNQIIGRMHQCGLLTKIEDDYFLRMKKKEYRGRNITSTFETNNNDYHVFSVSHLQFAFYNLCWGYGLSLIILLSEIFLYTWKNTDTVG